MKKTNNPLAKTNLFHEKQESFARSLLYFFMEFSKMAKGEISNEKKKIPYIRFTILVVILLLRFFLNI